MTELGDTAYLLHIRDAITRIQSYTQSGKAAFFADTMIQDAVVRNIEIIGEAVKHLSEEARQAQPDVPWRSIGAMRDKVIHEYFGVNLVLVWETVEQHVPVLKKRVEAALRAQATPSNSASAARQGGQPTGGGGGNHDACKP